MIDVERLRKCLDAVGPGKVPAEKLPEVVGLLSRCWRSLEGSGAEGMRDDKLTEKRTEELEWCPPTLKFRIERHGAVALGSSRAEIHLWLVNLDTEIAELAMDGTRQIYPMDRRLDTAAIAREIAALIRDGTEDERIGRRGGCARVVVSKVIPCTNQQTTRGRRQRFARDLTEILTPLGWQRKRAGTHLVFERAPSA